MTLKRHSNGALILCPSGALSTECCGAVVIEPCDTCCSSEQLSVNPTHHPYNWSAQVVLPCLPAELSIMGIVSPLVVVSPQAPTTLTNDTVVAANGFVALSNQGVWAVEGDHIDWADVTATIGSNTGTLPGISFSDTVFTNTQMKAALESGGLTVFKCTGGSVSGEGAPPEGPTLGDIITGEQLIAMGFAPASDGTVTLHVSAIHSGFDDAYFQFHGSVNFQWTATGVCDPEPAWVFDPFAVTPTCEAPHGWTDYGGMLSRVTTSLTPPAVPSTPPTCVCGFFSSFTCLGGWSTPEPDMMCMPGTPTGWQVSGTTAYGTFAQGTTPSAPETPVQCYWGWRCYWTCPDGPWGDVVSDGDPTTDGAASEWFPSGEFAYCVTTTSTPPAPPTDPAVCSYQYKSTYTCPSGPWSAPTIVAGPYLNENAPDWSYVGLDAYRWSSTYPSLPTATPTC